MSIEDAKGEKTTRGGMKTADYKGGTRREFRSHVVFCVVDTSKHFTFQLSILKKGKGAAGKKAPLSICQSHAAQSSPWPNISNLRDKD